VAHDEVVFGGRYARAAVHRRAQRRFIDNQIVEIEFAEAARPALFRRRRVAPDDVGLALVADQLVDGLLLQTVALTLFAANLRRRRNVAAGKSEIETIELPDLDHGV